MEKETNYRFLNLSAVKKTGWLATLVLSMLTCFDTLKAVTEFNTISLEEFGATDNLNASLHEESLLTAPDGVFRTNDFQNLQQSFDFSRPVVRVGNYYVSSAPYLNARDPGGPGVNYPSFVSNYSQAIVTSPNDVQFIFSCKEVDSEHPFQRLAKVLSSETLLIDYCLDGNEDMRITDYNVSGNAFHDIEYHQLTPLITYKAAILSIDIDDVHEPVPYNDKTLPAGSKFRIQLNNGQTWLLYVERSEPVCFKVSQNTSSLEAEFPFTGFFRLAVVQPTPVDTKYTQTPCSGGGVSPCPSWSTAAQMQTLPANPANMFMLWPYQWIPKIGHQIKTLIAHGHFVPSCDILSHLLPVLARSDLDAAQTLFHQLPTDSFDCGVNPFTVYFNMLMASHMSKEIDLYQQTIRPYPTYSIQADMASVEAVFDTYRHCIPVFADVFFDHGTFYSWKYSTIGGKGNPLIVFPAYKTLAEGFNPVAGFVNMDPIKGTILAVEASHHLVRFCEGDLPNWYNYSMPKVTFASDELNMLIQLFDAAKSDCLQPANCYYKGRMLYKLALTCQYGEYVLSQAKYSKEAIRLETLPLVSKIKAEIERWLIDRPAPGPNDQDAHFIGDLTAKGVCAIKGMKNAAPQCNAPNPGCTIYDFGNAYYNDHHFHYGYWLASAAVAIDWDEKYQTPDPWIARYHTSNGGIGSHKMKYFIDMLWRDSRNPSKEDIFNFNRHGNLWEGHSTANGLLCCVYGAGRNQESLAEDFHSWMGTGRYARAVLNCAALTEEDKRGFDFLRTFCDTNMKITATSGKLYYKDDNWIYNGNFANSNLTVGNQWDIKVDHATFFTPGEPCPVSLPLSSAEFSVNDVETED